MNRLSVTLVMPNFNHSAYLSRSLGAVMSQRAPVDEIIVVDDASTDDSLERIASITAADPRVLVIRHRERMGAIATINDGLRQATSELVAFPAADDFVFHNFVERLEPLLRANPAAGFACAAVEIRDGSERVLGKRPILWPTLRPRYVPAWEARRQLGRGDNFYLGAATIYRREHVLRQGGFRARLGSFADGYMQRTLAVTHGFCFDPTVLGVWRHHTTNYSITSVTNPESLEALLEEAHRCISAEQPGRFPVGYENRFGERLRFSASRLVILSEMPAAQKADRVARLTHMPPLEQSVVSPLYRFGSLGQTLIMTWLTLKFRPYSLFWLGTEPLRRLWSRLLRPPGDLEQAPFTPPSSKFTPPSG